MFRSNTAKASALIAAFGLTTLAIACGDKTLPTVTNVVILPSNSFTQTSLVSDIAQYGGTNIDPALVNPWGIAFDNSGALWVANAGTGTATSYDANGVKLGPTIQIPTAGTPIVTPSSAAPVGSPTGIVLNSTSDFVIPGHNAATYIFASEDGAIAAWESSMGTTAQLVSDQSGDTAGYKGLALANNGGANQLYATNFRRGRIDVFNASFALVTSFSDSTIPGGYAPFGIANIGGNLYVTYAKRDSTGLDDASGAGNGFVDVFTPAGALVRRFASGGTLNSPWAITIAPANFGPFAGNILVGNFGDGMISAFDATTGNLVDVVRDINASPMILPGLWGLAFGPAAGANTLYFAAGVGDELHGLVGRLAPR